MAEWDEMSERERDVWLWVNAIGCSEPEWDDGEPVFPMTPSVTLPHYTTDLSAAWRVVEKADAFILVKAEMDGATFYQAQLAFGDREGVYNYGDSMADAITHAAYLAVEGAKRDA